MSTGLLMSPKCLTRNYGSLDICELDCKIGYRHHFLRGQSLHSFYSTIGPNTIAYEAVVGVCV